MTLIPSRVSNAFCVRSSLDGRLFLLGLLDRPAATFKWSNAPLMSLADYGDTQVLNFSSSDL